MNWMIYNLLTKIKKDCTVCDSLRSEENKKQTQRKTASVMIPSLWFDIVTLLLASLSDGLRCHFCHMAQKQTCNTSNLQEDRISPRPWELDSWGYLWTLCTNYTTDLRHEAQGPWVLQLSAGLMVTSCDQAPRRSTGLWGDPGLLLTEHAPDR